MKRRRDHLIEYGRGIVAIDSGYVRPGFDASHLIVRDRRAAFVDTGTTHSVPALLAALDLLGLDVEQVDYIFLTHIHLDHAGGAGALLNYLPQARVVVHPRGLPHLIDPAKLIAGTRAVYGDAEFDRLYGRIVPIPSGRLLEAQDGMRLLVGRSPLTFIHTPGHALHHVCIVDHDAHAVFTGDTFGISYRELDARRREFIFPATTPTHFDPEAAHASIDRIMSFKPRACFLTHYGRVRDLERLAEDLHTDLVAFEEIARRCADAQDREEAIRCMMRAYLFARLDEHGFADDERRRDAILGMDLTLNAKGLVAWLERQARERERSGGA